MMWLSCARQLLRRCCRQRWRRLLQPRPTYLCRRGAVEARICLAAAVITIVVSGPIYVSFSPLPFISLVCQTVNDLLAPSLVFGGRAALVGDSGCILRPHTAAGTTKARLCASVDWGRKSVTETVSTACCQSATAPAHNSHSLPSPPGGHQRVGAGKGAYRGRG